MPEKLSELSGDITRLNAYIMTTLAQLTARGETTTDLLANIFKAYLSSSDRSFVAYVEKKQEAYDEGTLFTHTELMRLAANKYKTLVENGKWMAPSKEEKKILALESKIESYQKKNSSSTKKAEEKDPKKASKPKKGTKASGDKPKYVIPEWQKKYPGREFVDQNKFKEVEGKKYYWCKRHQRLIPHDTQSCKARHLPIIETPPAESSTSPPTSEAASIRVSSALLMGE